MWLQHIREGSCRGQHGYSRSEREAIGASMAKAGQGGGCRGRRAAADWRGELQGPVWLQQVREEGPTQDVEQVDRAKSRRDSNAMVKSLGFL